MTVWQIVALLIAGPIGLICLCKMFMALIHRGAEVHIVEIALMILCGILIALSFLGLRW